MARMPYVPSSEHERALSTLVSLRSAIISHQFRLLLEYRHLYQSVTIGRETLTVFLRSKSDGVKVEEEWAKEVFNGPWLLETQGRPLRPYVPLGEAQPAIPFEISGAKLMCARCGQVNPFNFVNGRDVMSEAYDHAKAHVQAECVQVFLLALQCQGCKDLPEIFLVSRRDLKITLTGRSPMETILIPDFLPKDQRKYFEGAILAFNCGQTLPGIFMFRTFIEQFVRSCSSRPSEPVDVLLDEYLASLDSHFKERFPSLKGAYGYLSEAIHAADESDEVFLRGKEDILGHFEARDLYKRVARKK